MIIYKEKMKAYDEEEFSIYFLLWLTKTKYSKGFYAAGASQSCAAILFTLAEVIATACISIKCTWSRPFMGNKAAVSFASELDFGVASCEGYFPYTGSKPHIDILIAASSKPADRILGR